MDQDQGIRTWQWVVTVIVIIILIVLGYYLFKGNGSTTNPNGTNATSTDQVSDANEINRIVVADQYPGNVVYISSAQLANGGWVEIHKDNNGQPGAIIGSTYVEKGIAPVKITLNDKTVDGQLYYAMLHSDDGDKKFDAAKDLPLKDSRGNIVMKTFRASTNVTEVKG
jgi:hypothetical protein